MRNHPLRLAALAILLAILLAVFLTPAIALATNEWRPYDRATFQKARAAGKTVFVSVHADW